MRPLSPNCDVFTGKEGVLGFNWLVDGVWKDWVGTEFLVIL